MDTNDKSNTQDKPESKFSRLKSTKLFKKESKKEPANKEPAQNQNQNQNAKPPVKTVANDKDSKNLQRLLAQREKELERLNGKVNEYTTKESRANLEVQCKDIFSEIGINDSAVKDVLEVVYNNFTFQNGKIINSKGVKGDVATFLREYTKDREYLLKAKKGSNLKSFSSATKLKSSSEGGSFAEFREKLKK